MLLLLVLLLLVLLKRNVMFLFIRRLVMLLRMLLRVFPILSFCLAFCRKKVLMLLILLSINFVIFSVFLMIRLKVFVVLLLILNIVIEVFMSNTKRKSVDVSTGEIFSSFRHPYSRTRFPFVGSDVSMTHQSHAESCDINKIIAQFDRSGLLPPDPRGRTPVYDDVSDLNRDLTSLIGDAREAAMALEERRAVRRAEASAKFKADKAAFDAWKASQVSSEPVIPASSASS